MKDHNKNNTNMASFETDSPFDFSLNQLFLCNLSGYDPDGYDVLNDLKNLNFRDAQTCIASLLDVAHQNKSQTKEILAYHVEGCYYLFKRKYTEAMLSLDKAMSMAKKTENNVAFAIIAFDYIKACNVKHRWDLIHKTLKEIEHIYQELDLVDEKIHTMIHLSDFYRKFGDLESALKLVHLAHNLHTNFSEFSQYSHKLSHHIYIQLSQALIEKKKGNFAAAQETAQNMQKDLENASDDEIEKGNRLFFQVSLYLILGECYLETGNRDKSFANLNHFKKFLEKYADPALESKYRILKAEHELIFEKKAQPTDIWLNNFSIPWSLGDVEYCMDQLLRILNKYHDDHTMEDHEALIDHHQSLLESTMKKLPKDMMSHFMDFYEFKEAISLKASANYQMKKFIDFSRTLICEHNIDELTQKSLDLVADFTRMDRGFLMLFDSTEPHFSAIHNFSVGHLEVEESPEAGCLALAKSVLKSGHPFVKSHHYNQDLFMLLKSEEDVINQISRNEFLVLPLLVNGDGIGVMYMDGKGKSEIKDGGDIEVLENLAAVIAYAINNAYQLSTRETDLKSVKRLLDKHKNELKIQKYSYENFIGISEKKRELFVMLQKTLDSTATITLTGESGVGKEMIAKMIHYNGERKRENFVALNCAAIPENLLESELFGYVKGSFTGANEDKEGLFVAANNGTLFLDEIGEMPLSMQVKLIRVLQEREVSPVGGATPIKVDVRIICATNRNLETMVKEGAFREDLYYRINVVNIAIPSLRERREDVPLLVDHALRMYALENNVPQKTVSTQAMKFLMMYPWPGNVRELINVMYNLSIFVEGPTIELKDLEDRQELFRTPIDMEAAHTTENFDLNDLSSAIDEQQLTLSEAKSEFERHQIERALKLYNGQITSASYHLQMPRPQVSRLVKKYNLKEER